MNKLGSIGIITIVIAYIAFLLISLYLDKIHKDKIIALEQKRLGFLPEPEYEPETIEAEDVEPIEEVEEDLPIPEATVDEEAEIPEVPETKKTLDNGLDNATETVDTEKDLLPKSKKVISRKIKELAKKISEGKKIKAKADLQLQANYAEELEVELKKLIKKSKKKVTKSKK